MSDEKRQAAGEVPSAIGRYQITGALGFGAMGAVYKAFDPLIKRTLAIKTIRLDIPRQSPQHQAFIERFYQEARISGTLSHPNIVTLFDIGEENERAVPRHGVRGREDDRRRPRGGDPLQAREGDRPREPGRGGPRLRPLARASSTGTSSPPTSSSTTRTRSRSPTSASPSSPTPRSRTPGRCSARRPTCRPSRRWGRSSTAGATSSRSASCAFEMLSGEQPFPGANVTSILYKLVHVDPVEPADLEMNGLVPQKWREVFHKVLAKKPENRYQTASAFVQDLEYCLGSWFAGLGTEETVSLQVSVPDQSTVTIPKTPAPAVSAPNEEQETLVLVDAPPAEEKETIPHPPAPCPSAGGRPVGDDPRPPAAGRSVAGRRGDGPAAARPPDRGGGPSPDGPDADRPRRTATLPPEPTMRDAGGSRRRRAGASGPASRACLSSGPSVAPPSSSPWPSASSGWALWQRSRSAAGRGASPPPPVAGASPSPPAPTPEALAPQPGQVGRPAHRERALRRARQRERRGERARRRSGCPTCRSARTRCGWSRRATRRRRATVSLDAERGGRRAAVRARAPRAGRRAGPTSSRRRRGPRSRWTGGRSGRRPSRGLKLKPGKRRLEVALDGHETWTETVDVAAGETGRVEVRLKALPAGPPLRPPRSRWTPRASTRTPRERSTRSRRSSRAALRPIPPTAPAA